MTEDELAEFLAQGPIGAICVADADGQLLALPARVVDSDSARFSMSIENIPSENPKTGRITALSVIAYLRKLNSPLRVGT